MAFYLVLTHNKQFLDCDQSPFCRKAREQEQNQTEASRGKRRSRRPKTSSFGLRSALADLRANENLLEVKVTPRYKALHCYGPLAIYYDV